jgi:hypothetical protein
VGGGWSETYPLSVILNNGFYQADRASRKEAKDLKPDQVSEVILDDSEESENENTETVDGEEAYEQLGFDQLLLQQKQAPSQSVQV